MSVNRIRMILNHVSQPKTGPAWNALKHMCSHSQQHQAIQGPVITAEPRVALYDDKVKITLKNFPKNEKITLHGHFVQGRKTPVVFASCGHYVTDDTGQVDVLQQPSSGGTYKGMEPMGILWSMEPAPGNPRFTRMAINFTDKPSLIQLKAYQGHISLEDIYNPSSEINSLANVNLERWFRRSDVTRIEVQVGNIRGALYLPPGEGPFKGVIDIFGSAGGIIEYRSALLASRGFASFALAYFNYKDLTPHLPSVTFDYFEEAVNWFSAHPKVHPYGIGLVATSKGVEYGYAMSAFCPQVKCVVAINGYPFIGWNDLYHKGEVLFQASPFDTSRLEITDEGMIVGRVYDESGGNLIPSWNQDAKHLLLTSEDDFQLCLDSYKMIIEACPEEKKCNYEEVRYPKAGHLLEPPYNPLCRSCPNKYFSILMLFGGYKKEHAHAQEDAWQRLLNHLDKHIPTSE